MLNDPHSALPDGSAYATLDDDRVVPAHSFKYAATLQALASKESPILIRIETKSGHGASSLTKALEATGDIYAFLMHTLGVEPKNP